MEAEQPRTVRQVRDLIAWIGTGRKLTQTGKATLADARALVALLETGNTVDPSIGDRTFKTKTSQEPYHVNLLVEWAKSARLLRTVSGRVVPVKKNARVLEDPELLVQALFDALSQAGPRRLRPPRTRRPPAMARPQDSSRLRPSPLRPPSNRPATPRSERPVIHPPG
ncbi:hypothetical protein P3T34_004340 [Kitasatospora sp. MAP12-44]|nr:hypothetical protein [Kitasatospora sp. MAP12-44]